MLEVSNLTTQERSACTDGTQKIMVIHFAIDTSKPKPADPIERSPHTDPSQVVLNSMSASSQSDSSVSLQSPQNTVLQRCANPAQSAALWHVVFSCYQPLSETLYLSSNLDLPTCRSRSPRGHQHIPETIRADNHCRPYTLELKMRCRLGTKCL